MSAQEQIKTYDLAGCRPYCYGGYHMEEVAEGWGDWVRKEDHEAAVKAAEAAAIERCARWHEERAKNAVFNLLGGSAERHRFYASELRALLKTDGGAS